MSEKDNIIILAIESSCDDTSAAVLKNGVVLSNVTAGQSIHEEYGGVVPEVASRAHLTNILPVVQVALSRANIEPSDLTAIAFTRGPGLLGSLLVGVTFAKSMALSLDIPLVEVHHIQGHVAAHLIDEPRPQFPFLCLTVAGGHTQIMVVKSPNHSEIIGKTIDDAAGEAFDKSGKLLGLGYPAGPKIDELSKKGTPRFAFPEPDVQGLNFSFSGLKTSILRFLEKNTAENPFFIQENLADICASIQHIIVTILMKKLKKAVKETGIKEVAIAGGVSANSGLRDALSEYGEKYGWNTYIPAFKYCTDNAAMIAIAGYYKFLDGDFSSQDAVAAARM